ncbi:MAG: hypothetical protein IJ867_05770 [Clostridia bacterium]|nr:hypothetical protein [Clostridia bacterium]
MELMGFYYDNKEYKLPANGCPIPKELSDKGYVQKNNSEGVPRWYVKPNRVFILLNINGENQKFDIYSNIMALHPNRVNISLKLVHEVMAKILCGKILIEMKDGKPFLTEVQPKSKKTRK